eukprot:GCRY01004640.1.p1 GENE.GCRY01004640.1~~GCRY01004640.1.p1  ORF type:complete len:424 (-),score=53.44 GCRY01004640.1:693-1964(-)
MRITITHASRWLINVVAVLLLVFTGINYYFSFEARTIEKEYVLIEDELIEKQYALQLEELQNMGLNLSQVINEFLENIRINPPPSNIRQLIYNFRRGAYNNLNHTIINTEYLSLLCPNVNFDASHSNNINEPDLARSAKQIIPMVAVAQGKETERISANNHSQSTCAPSAPIPNTHSNDRNICVNNSSTTNTSSDRPSPHKAAQMLRTRDIRPGELGSCAVVSSSSRLLNSSLGSLIDSYDFVFRPGNSKTVGFEDDVGRRTDIRGAHSWKYAYSQNNQDGTFILYGAIHHASPEAVCRFKGVLGEGPSALPILRLTPEFTTFIEALLPRSFSILPTSGFFSIINALFWCEKVDLYCFEGWGFGTSAFLDPLARVHYYDNNRGAGNIAAMYLMLRKHSSHPYWQEWAFIQVGVGGIRIGMVGE